MFLNDFQLAGKAGKSVGISLDIFHSGVAPRIEVPFGTKPLPPLLGLEPILVYHTVIAFFLAIF